VSGILNPGQFGQNMGTVGFVQTLGSLPATSQTITSTGIYSPMAKSTFEQAFKIATLISDRYAPDLSVKDFNQLVLEVQAKLDE